VSFRQHPRTPAIPEHAPEITTSAPPEAGAAAAVTRPVPRTRAGAVWVGVCAAAVIAVALVIFAVQNTRSVEISFLWMTTSTPLALALLIGAVGGILLTLVLGTARITQLRRQVRGPKR
jgi:putative membrane protein